jgi:glutamine cyclotransferase
MSNGTSAITFRDPRTFVVSKTITVSDHGTPVSQLNELEFIEGEIFANVWHSEEILRINPADGTVVGVIDLTGIDAASPRRDPEFVLNGIAYDADKRELYVTGKCWPKIYQIRLVEKK